MTEMPLDAAALDVYDALLRAVVICPRQEDHERVSAQARAALTLRDELAALVGELAECRAKLAQVEQEAARYRGQTDILDESRARVAELEAKLADERRHAEFGSRAFESFWCDGEPGDLDAGDLQSMALDCGLLRHVDASDGPGPHCEWCEDDVGAGDECSCLKPTTSRRAKEAVE